MTASALSLQDAYLQRLQKAGARVVVSLLGGKELRGTVTGYDNFTLVLSTDRRDILVYKHALSTIASEEPLPAR